MRRKRGGVMGSFMTLISSLVMLGIGLAILSQFGWDWGSLLKWILNAMWNFVTTIKDTIASWPAFQRLF